MLPLDHCEHAFERVVVVVAGNQYFLACIARRVTDMEQVPAVQNVEQFVTKQDLSGKILACDTRSETYSLISVVHFQHIFGFPGNLQPK